MKTKLRRTVFSVIAALGSMAAQAQTIATFENLTLSPNSYWNGSSTPLGTSFTSGDAIFTNYYDTAYGGFWSSGWAYSNMTDSTTGGSSNIFSARTAVGYDSSENYVIGQQGAVVNLNPTAIGGVVNGFYVTNTTYAVSSIKNGDAFARKFGDTTGTNSGLAQGGFPDWFKLSVMGYRSGSITSDTVNFYLADYRFADSAADYIVTDWRWVDLTPLGNVDSVVFSLSSSDNGEYGMNTPAFFAMDNFTTASLTTGILSKATKPTSINVFPNPCSNELNIQFSEPTGADVLVSVKDVTGKLVYSATQNTSANLRLNISNFENGIYFINVAGGNLNLNQKFIKQ